MGRARTAYSSIFFLRISHSGSGHSPQFAPLNILTASGSPFGCHFRHPALLRVERISIPEYFQIQSIRHCLIARVIRMDVIAGIEQRPHPDRPGRIPNHRIKIHDSIKKAAHADPLIHCLSYLFAAFRL